jgi:hypothetical protein
MSLDAKTAWRLVRACPLPELPARVGRFLRRGAEAARRRRAFARGDLEIDDVRFARALVPGRDPSAPLTFRLGITDMDAAARGRFAAAFIEAFPPVHAAIVAAADDACAHRFDILGSGPVELGPAIDWSRDFKSGFRWPLGYAPDLRLVDLSNDADVKVCWDLSRGHHLVTLGQAYWLTGRDVYAEEVVAQLQAWTAANPVGGSVNWGNAMEAAIRIVNWLWAVALIRDAPALRADARRLVRRMALAHGRFILDHLEIIVGRPASNHYLSDLVGLVYLGVLLPELREAAQWKETGLTRLLDELTRQVHEDGVDYEGSTSYHRLVAELFASAFAVCRPNGVDVPAAALSRLGRMIEFTRHYTRPDGRAPLLGDADDGRVHVLTPGASDDHRHLLAFGGALLAWPEWLAAAGEHRAEAAWWFGMDAATVGGSDAPAARSRAFAAGGIYVMREGPSYLIADCAGPAPLRGHTHNDTLGFELAVHGRAFIVDPGTYAYTSSTEWRNHFRRTAAHNTVAIDGQEMNTLVPGELFTLGGEARVRLHRWESTAEQDVLDAEHHGYQRLPGAPVHRRRITFEKRAGGFRIEDEVVGSGRHRLQAFLHFAEGVRLEAMNDREWTASLPGAALRVTCSIGLTAGQDWVSRRYGRKAAAPVLSFDLDSDLPASWWWELRPVIEPR